MTKRMLVFHGWIIVATGIVASSLGYGARYSFSVIFPSLLDEFGWPRDITAAVLSVHILAYGLVAPMAGVLVDQIGPRITMVIGTIVLALGLALSGGSSTPWHFYLTFGVLAGAGLCLIGAVPFTSVIRNWFERQRGLALSLLFFGAGGAFALYPAIAFLVRHLGWRGTFVAEAIVIASIMLPLVLLFVRYHPRDRGVLPDGMAATEGGSGTAGGAGLEITDHAWAAVEWTLLKATRTNRFWMLCLAAFSVWGVMEHIMVTHHIAFAADLGFSRIYASSVLSLIGVSFAVGSLLGSVSDRIGREPTMTIGSVMGISGILALALMDGSAQPWILYYYAIAMGLGLGVTAPTIAATATDIFQGPKIGAIIGFVWFSFAVGGCIGPWLGGWLFELDNDYLVAFLVAMAMYAVGCGAIWLAAPRRVRLVPGRVTIRSQS